MRVKGRNANKRFAYDGSKGLEVEVQKCREELEKKIRDAKRNHLRWAYEKAKKEYEAYEQRITDLRDFIDAAEKEIGRKGTNNA